MTDKLPRRGIITAIAAHCHVPRDRALKILHAVGMRRDKGNTFLFAKAVEHILASIDPARSAGHVAGGDESALSDGVAANVASLSNAKARYEDMRVRKMAIEIEKAEGRLIERARVLEVARDIAAHIRAGLAGVGAKVANDFATATDASKAQALVDGAIHDALLKLCDLGAYMLGEAPG